MVFVVEAKKPVGQEGPVIHVPLSRSRDESEQVMQSEEEVPEHVPQVESQAAKPGQWEHYSATPRNQPT